LGQQQQQRVTGNVSDTSYTKIKVDKDIYTSI